MDAIVYECAGVGSMDCMPIQQWPPRRKQYRSIAGSQACASQDERYKKIRITVWKTRTERTSLHSSNTSTTTNEMRSSITSACLAASFISAVQAADIKTWKLAFWSGSHCTSAEVALIKVQLILRCRKSAIPFQGLVSPKLSTTKLQAAITRTS